MDFRALTFALGAVLLVAGADCASAEERQSLSWARIFDNDAIGDTHDRWRTGSYQVSNFRGPAWTGAAPAGFGRLIELRFRGEIIAPDNLAAPAPTDRRHAGILSFGLHTYMHRGAWDMNVGADLVIVGPQTGLRSFQERFHKLVGADPMNVAGFEIPNGTYPTITAEASREYAFADTSARLRPFVEAQAGVETLVRVGADLTWGTFGRGGLRMRDTVTGQRLPAIAGAAEAGTSILLGADTAWVADSQYLPGSLGYRLTDARSRLRAGVHWAGGRTSVFYGLTYLSPEFEAQPEGQIVGSFTWRLKF